MRPARFLADRERKADGDRDAERPSGESRPEVTQHEVEAHESESRRCVRSGKTPGVWQ
jgi:hypothetical protein